MQASHGFRIPRLRSSYTFLALDRRGRQSSFNALTPQIDSDERTHEDDLAVSNHPPLGARLGPYERPRHTSRPVGRLEGKGERAHADDLAVSNHPPPGARLGPRAPPYFSPPWDVSRAKSRS